MKYPKDISGVRFGRLTVVEEVIGEGKGKRGYKSKWLCQCDCGNKTITFRNSLVSGHTKSCGCLKFEVNADLHRTHGLSKTRLWTIWVGMKDRCERKNNKNYSNYGGRGIKVCEEWKASFESFNEWALNNGYSDELTIDRINPEGDYCPGNCRWASRVEQTRNRRNTIKMHDGTPLAEVAEKENIGYQQAYDKYIRKTNSKE